MSAKAKASTRYQAEEMDISAERLAGGPVRLGLGDKVVELSVDEWCTLVATVTVSGYSDETQMAVALVHAGKSKVDIAVMDEVVAQIALSLARPQLLPTEKPHIHVPSSVDPFSRSGR